MPAFVTSIYSLYLSGSVILFACSWRIPNIEFCWILSYQYIRRAFPLSSSQFVSVNMRSLSGSNQKPKTTETLLPPEFTASEHLLPFFITVYAHLLIINPVLSGSYQRGNRYLSLQRLYWIHRKPLFAFGKPRPKFDTRNGIYEEWD